tara:strand:- start:2926 stop:3138 length:213 start_codon:yes stop_codon:yes gene_type:complete
MKDKLQYPTIAIQLVNPQGMPYDMPDDWIETVLSIAAIINDKYKIGVDTVFGTASREGFEILSKECSKEE